MCICDKEAGWVCVQHKNTCAIRQTGGLCDCGLADALEGKLPAALEAQVKIAEYKALCGRDHAAQEYPHCETFGCHDLDELDRILRGIKEGGNVV